MTAKKDQAGWSLTVKRMVSSAQLDQGQQAQANTGAHLSEIEFTVVGLGVRSTPNPTTKIFIGSIFRIVVNMSPDRIYRSFRGNSKSEISRREFLRSIAALGLTPERSRPFLPAASSPLPPHIRRPITLPRMTLRSLRPPPPRGRPPVYPVWRLPQVNLPCDRHAPENIAWLCTADEHFPSEEAKNHAAVVHARRLPRSTVDQPSTASSWSGG
jgi:hypothetical protein